MVQHCNFGDVDEAAPHNGAKENFTERRTNSRLGNGTKQPKVKVKFQ